MSDHARTTMPHIVRGGGRLSAPAGAGRGDGGAATEQDAGQAVAKPFVKWAGGKRKLAPEIARYVPEKFNNYYEPFVGGGAVFFHLHSAEKLRKKVFLSDANASLVKSYMAIMSDDHEKLIKRLGEWQRKHGRKGEDFYEEVKRSRPRTKVGIAAKLIYLNKTCFNGLYRVNSRGEFNVPMGSYVNPKICDEKNIRAVHKFLTAVDAKIDNHSFEKIKPKRNDVVYCDPPYDDTFTAYTGNKFGRDSQERLCEKCWEWRDKGVHVIVSNSNTDFIRGMYEDYGFYTYVVKAARHISCDGSGRGKVEELIITSCEAGDDK